jgi:hypothetical protein
LGLAQELALLMALASRFVTIGASIVTTYLPIWRHEAKFQSYTFGGAKPSIQKLLGANDFLTNRQQFDAISI